jgi:chromosome segregation ATPase
MFDEICKDLDSAQETISTLRHNLAASDSRNGDEFRRLELDRAAVRERLAATEEVKTTLVEARDAAIRAQGEARDEATRLTGRLAAMTSELSAERSRASFLQQRLAESEREREAAAQKTILAEQRAAHADSTAGEQKERVRELRDELSHAKDDRAELQARTSALLERLGQAETRAAIAEAQLKAPQKKPPIVANPSTKRGSTAKGGNGIDRP